MRSICLIVSLNVLIGASLYGQTHKAKPPVKNNAAVKNIPQKKQDPPHIDFTLPKIDEPQLPQISRTLSADSAKYSLSDSVDITDGKDEIQRVFITAVVPVKIWDELLKSKLEKEFFATIGQMLALKAQYELKNPLSFVPFKKEFFAWSEDRQAFISSFKMMARNGYGNSSETSILVEYDPHSR